MLIQSTKGASSGRLKGVILAPSGHGKTFIASTIKEPTLLISAESGHLTLNKFDMPMIDVTVDLKEGKKVMLSDKERFDKILSVLVYLKTEEAQKKFKWIYIDGITEIGGIVIRMLEKSERFSAQKMVKPRYGEYTKIMTTIILAFRDLPYYNVFFTALTEKKEDIEEKTGKVLKRYPASILMPGSKIPDSLPAFFDEILYLGVKDDEAKTRYILTQPTNEAFAKDRSGNLDKFEKANLTDIANKIKGEKK